MKNLSVSKKLINGFGIVLILMLLSGVFSIFNLHEINSEVERYSKYSVPNSEYIRAMQVNLRSTMHELLGAMLTKPEEAGKMLSSADQHSKSAIDKLEDFKKNQSDSSRNADIEQAKTIINSGSSVREEISKLILANTDESHKRALELYQEQYSPQLEKVISIMENIAASSHEKSKVQKLEAERIMLRSEVLLASVSVLSILITIFIIIFIRKSILVPVQKIIVMNKEAARGNLDTEIEYESRDEFGQMIEYIKESNALQRKIIGDIIEKFTSISEGNLQFNVDMDYPGDYEILKKAIETTADNLNVIMETISTAASQVSAGASQVSDGALALASGSTEQASSIEELSASIEHISSRTEENASVVKTVTGYVEQAGQGAKSGNDYMQKLTDAMAEIDTASNEIVNITKAIDDIAFQTNMLSLNAAIEAARAGSAGKGFTVVADEVRNLAGKSAEAAKQTAELIQNTVAAVSRGTELTDQTAKILQEVGSNTRKVADSFVQIEQASAEQSDAVEQMKQGLTQVSSVVQTNAATAEENSATSEEMSAQADTLRAEVEKFKLKDSIQKEYASENSTPEEIPEPEDCPEIDEENDEESDLGKY
ncbi:methyl-accepting chemotaxis protein [Clostridium sp. C105KSO13]|uniref:methyl-accepting chemotaxis protein n=1 Tax=Clostridium sp. C105KSO13 TaxID=1776045 RepID=UPI000740711C|nr:methyl-accepting chemotaxis protein [Clostridium sp. C105KSO13]CUX49702.1 Methyl-accepting chemotaxis protein IV [Clostridium sp. C105KSO13]